MARLIYTEVTDPNHVLDEHDELTSAINVLNSPSPDPSDWLGCLSDKDVGFSGVKFSVYSKTMRCRRPANCEANRRILKRRRKNELHRKNEIRRQWSRIDSFRKRLKEQGLIPDVNITSDGRYVCVISGG